MSDDGNFDRDRRTLLQLAALAGLPLAAGSASADRTDGEGSGDAAAATGDHLGETWTGSDGLSIDLSGFSRVIDATTEEGFGLRARVTSSTDATGIGIYGESSSEYGEGVYGEATSSTGETKGVYGVSSSPDGYGVYGANYSGSGGYGVYSDGDLHVDGDFTATGTKNFVQTVETPDGPRNVAYTAVEADRAQTETTGVAELEDGRAEIDLPEHFAMVTSDDEDLVVQLTPYAVGAPGLAVAGRSTERVVVESEDGTGDIEFSYTVRGTRKGYEDEAVVRDADD